MASVLHKQYIDESLKHLPAGIGSLESGWSSPSNIALVKYWGKASGQIPRNPSLSFSLEKARTEMKMLIKPGQGKDFSLDYLFEAERNQLFGDRIRQYLISLFPYFPFLEDCSVEIRSHNTFPHSSGIASSASSMSALALCICSIEEKIHGGERGDSFFQKASYMSRLGSGSASRSVYGGFASWGVISGDPGSSDEFATPLDLEPGEAFRALHDSVLIVSPRKKKVSSSQGHALMETHPFAGKRYEQSRANFGAFIKALTGNDVETFMRVTENEALTLHGLMLSSDPGFMLLEPASLEILSRIRKFREDTGIFLTFTIDAGPNVHLIYPDTAREQVKQFIEDQLLALCQEGSWIDDRMGHGPEEL